MKRALVLAALFCVMAGKSSPSYAAESSAAIAAAKKEGKLIIYSSTDSASVEPLLQDFKALYPFVQVEYNDLNTTEIYNRFTAESASGAGTADFIWSSAMDLQLQLASKGNALNYASPENASLPKWAVWQNQAYGTTFEPVSIAYNKRLLPADAVPQSHADLVRLMKAKPDVFKEKIATFDPEKSGVGFLMMTQDAKVFPQFWDLAKGLGSTGAKVYTSTGAMLEKVGSGEHTLAYNIIGSYVLLRQKKDPSLGLVLPKDYTLVFSRIAFISKTARNPNAAKLFLDYILSKRGQTVMSDKSLVYSIRSDVPGRITAAGLNKDLGKAIKPIEVNTDILAGLEQSKRLEFMKQWKEALKR
ncbi:MAG TPA: ABC transporter substrate-binding protein [Candidatus Binatia bacterium]|jgi:iron(III) transport system substrate-binding protein